ncbi:MAG TPA: hypothetical protein VGE52_06825, partial [Pirellulales bacterium]
MTSHLIGAAIERLFVLQAEGKNHCLVRCRCGIEERRTVADLAAARASSREAMCAVCRSASRGERDLSDDAVIKAYGRLRTVAAVARDLTLSASQVGAILARAGVRSASLHVCGVDYAAACYGRMTVRRPLDERPTGQSLWRCRCDCGEEEDHPPASLASAKAQGRLPQCSSCRQREKAEQAARERMERIQFAERHAAVAAEYERGDPIPAILARHQLNRPQLYSILRSARDAADRRARNVAERWRLARKERLAAEAAEAADSARRRGDGKLGRDWTGRRFGRLTVVDRGDGGRWRVRCACGREEMRTAAGLTEAVGRGREPMCAACRRDPHGTFAVRNAAMAKAYRETGVIAVV